MCRFARVRVGGPAWVGVGGLARVGVWTWLVSVHVGVVSTRLVSKSVRVGVVSTRLVSKSTYSGLYITLHYLRTYTQYLEVLGGVGGI